MYVIRNTFRLYVQQGVEVIVRKAQYESTRVNPDLCRIHHLSGARF